MTGRPDKVQARMDPHIELAHSVRLLLLPHVRLVLVINKVDDRCPAVLVVDIVSKARGIDDCQFHLELLLLQLSFDDINLCVLFLELLDVSAVVVSRLGELGAKEGVDQSRLSQSGLADDHEGEVSSSLCYNLVTLIGQVGDTAVGGLHVLSQWTDGTVPESLLPLS